MIVHLLFSYTSNIILNISGRKSKLLLDVLLGAFEKSSKLKMGTTKQFLNENAYFNLANFYAVIMCIDAECLHRYWVCVFKQELAIAFIQVRIEGRAERISQEESLKYFHSRPRESQLGAIVSQQSTVISSREVGRHESSV